MKSGWAAVVLMVGRPESPRAADSRRIDLSDPAIPESRQPYHEGFGTARASGRELSRLLSSVRRFGRESATDLLRQYRAAGHELGGVGIVCGSLIDPEGIANEHIRIHALEGRLFRSVVKEAAEGMGLTCSIWRDRDVYRAAADTLRQPENEIRATVARLKGTVGGSWRAEQKAAAVAAWLLLAACGAESSAKPKRMRVLQKSHQGWNR